MRKRLMSGETFRAAEHAGVGDIASLATFTYSSEHPDFPLEHLVDGRNGLGGTRWASAQVDVTEYIQLEFDPV